MATRRNDATPARTRRLPATTPEDREQQMIALAYDLAEERMLNNEASAQEITHWLKMGSARARLEEKKLEMENEFLSARIEALASNQRIEELYTEAIQSMRRYSGQDPTPEFPDEDYYDD